MAKSKIDIKMKSVKELLKTLSEHEKKLLDTKISVAQGKTKDTHSGRNIRIEIARLKTIIKEKEIAG